jgi:DNA-binding Lrp family transcriptional regulator
LPTAFVVINSEIGMENEVLKQLKTLPNVKEACPVYGVYDIIAKVTADTQDKLKEIVTSKIRGLNNVRSTLTMLVVE